MQSRENKNNIKIKALLLFLIEKKEEKFLLKNSETNKRNPLKNYELKKEKK